MSARFVFKEREKTRTPGEKSLGERERTNNKLNPHNYGVDAGNWKQATFVGGEFSHHCNAVAPRWLKHCRLFHDVTKSHRLFDEFIFFQIQVPLWRSLLNGRSPVQFLKVLQLLMSLRPRPNVKTFTRLTKLCELSSWKVRRLAQSRLPEWVWIVQHVTSEDRLRKTWTSIFTRDELN